MFRVIWALCIQNRGSLFALDPKHLNRLEPRKRPFQTIIPGFITKDGQPWLSFGLMGGDMQAQGHAQVICNLIDFGMDVQEAGDAAGSAISARPSQPASRPRGAAWSPWNRASPRLCEVSSKPRATAWSRHPAPTAATRRFASTWSTVSSSAGSDPRKDGAAMGY